MPIFPGWKAEPGQHLEKTVRKRKEKQEQRRVPEIVGDNRKMHGWASGDCPRAGRVVSDSSGEVASTVVGTGPPTGSRRAGSVVVAHGPSCSVACGIFPDQGSNPCPLHWQADSQPLRHQGSPKGIFFK
ncbi:hypothetical protein J1605_015200 [Eschrichtius robustus]|uniref:Uncharacterized protein n=1 Tax=Eschrichtius robustus TaxID=9764 RepID=A0AB34GA87_ESCRO|nr:hypothetical protein J1605_015200 [Eschrichtius robustus]